MNYMVVLDASTLILLAKCDLLPLLAERTRLAIPPEIQREALAKPELYDARVIAALIKAGRIEVLAVAGNLNARQVQKDFGIEAGETAALLLAKEQAAPLATDDWPAIKAAKVLGVPFLTAIHVLLELHAKGRLTREVALAKLDTLEKVGRYNVRILEDARAKMRSAR